VASFNASDFSSTQLASALDLTANPNRRTWEATRQQEKTNRFSQSNELFLVNVVRLLSIRR
jgi:hypothetical protein